jgi:hypothetical protein
MHVVSLLLVLSLYSVSVHLNYSNAKKRSAVQVRTDVDLQNLCASQMATIAHARDFQYPKKENFTASDSVSWQASA